LSGSLSGLPSLAQLVGTSVGSGGGGWDAFSSILGQQLGALLPGGAGNLTSSWNPAALNPLTMWDPTALSGNPLSPAVVPPAPAPEPASVSGALQQWANQMNQNLYGFDPSSPQGPQTMGILGTAGFPMYGDPRTTMDYLAQLSQGMQTNPNISREQALAQFQQMLAAQNAAGGGGYGGGYGGGGQGPDIGGGATN